MRRLPAGIGLFIVLQPLFIVLEPSLLLGQTTGTCERAFETGFQPGGNLRLEVRSGDIDVIGTDSPVVRVECDLKRSDRARDIAIKFTPSESSGNLRIRGGPNSDVRFRIEVPKSSHLFVRAPAGDLDVSGVVGDKDVEIHAGDLTISVGDAAHYKHADASVGAGDLNAVPFGVNKGGLFRSFNKDNPAGKYHLHAHVGAGDLTLK
jgi:hypothetical protein